MSEKGSTFWEIFVHSGKEDIRFVILCQKKYAWTLVDIQSFRLLWCFSQVKMVIFMCLVYFMEVQCVFSWLFKTTWYCNYVHPLPTKKDTEIRKWETWKLASRHWNENIPQRWIHWEWSQRENATVTRPPSGKDNPQLRVLAAAKSVVCKWPWIS